MCRSGAIDLICVDSVSALTPRAEIEVSYHLSLSLSFIGQSWPQALLDFELTRLSMSDV